MSETRPAAERAQAVRWAHRTLAGRKGAHWDNYATALTTMEDEIDVERPNRFAHDLDEIARDALLAHGRQDAAHALCNTKSLLDDISGVRQLLWLIAALLIVAIGSIRHWF